MLAAHGPPYAPPDADVEAGFERTLSVSPPPPYSPPVFVDVDPQIDSPEAPPSRRHATFASLGLPHTRLATPAPHWPPLPKLPTYEEAVSGSTQPRPIRTDASFRVGGTQRATDAEATRGISRFIATASGVRVRPLEPARERAAMTQQRACRGYALAALVVCGYVAVSIVFLLGIYLLSLNHVNADAE
ncbi:membrane protein UL56 [Saimiriine alphaherpesvirus 1]|uniref:Membrane protein UL56 n=1 Tax=Saimiriine herpesvirus 1 (strain MV-5-4-PSL) TaxID=10353 RepID=E2IUB4_SHV1|nr:membrane protein UL56 [Saimiriine alphaherpesvirus 1]ADO13772.1 membrane protein UL56 [Saimiriine alphaherpesvirus 1]